MAETIQRSFTAGEISPSLQSRADIAKYTNGLARCENFIVKSQGGIVSRPGFKYIKNLLTGSSGASIRMIPFEYSADDTYMLVFRSNKMYVIKDGVAIVGSESNGAVLNTTLLSDAYLPNMSYTQAGNIMFLSGLNNKTYKLIRTSDTVWSLEVFSEDLPDAANIIGPMVTGGDGPGTYDKEYSYKATWVNTDGIESASPTTAATITSKSLTTTFYVEVYVEVPAGTSSSDVSHFNIYKSTDNAHGVFGLIGSISREAGSFTPGGSFRDYNYAPDTTQPLSDTTHAENISPNAPHEFSARAMTFYQQRLIMGGLDDGSGNASLFDLIMSKTDKFNRFEYRSPSLADDSILLSIASRKIDEIRHVIDMNGLLVFTTGAIHSITDGQDGVMSPSTAGTKVVSYSGASKTVPIVLNDSIIYVQDKGSRLRDFSPTRDQSISNGVDLSIMAEHLFNGYEITSMAHAEEPYGVIWCVRDDGLLIALTYQKEHQVWAWHTHTTREGDEYINVQTVREGEVDAVYVTVDRQNVNGNPHNYYVERLSSRDADRGILGVQMDSYLPVANTNVTDDSLDVVFTGLDHIEGVTVSITHSDGIIVKDEVVTGGSVTVKGDTYKVSGTALYAVVGIPYSCIAETLAIDTQSVQETLKTKQMSINTVTIETLNSRGGYIGSLNHNGELVGDMQEIKPRDDADGYDAITLKSQQVEVTLSNGWGTNGKVRIEQPDPLPLTITSIIPELDISG